MMRTSFRVVPRKITNVSLRRSFSTGKMVEFAGWEMPIQYGSEGIITSHLHTRQNASLFDVSHMVQLRITGKDRVKFLEGLVVADIQGLPSNHATLSVFTNENGGIIDDTIITNRGDHIFLVVNAGCADKDIAHLTKHIGEFTKKGGDAKLEVIPRSLIALQGPKAESVLQKLVSVNLSKMPFMTCQTINLVDNKFKDITVSRCGYTGEDGFEISVSHDDAVPFAERLLSFPEVKPSGLGARDSLRLEAGLCLYGHDIEQNTTPVEAALAWCIQKRRREQGGFLGASTILPQLKAGTKTKRVGFLNEGPPAREGTPIHDKASDKQIGHITSGTYSPVLKRSIAMGYIETPFSKLNTEVVVKVRGKAYPGVVAKMPFVPTNYKKID